MAFPSDLSFHLVRFYCYSVSGTHKGDSSGPRWFRGDQEFSDELTKRANEKGLGALIPSPMN